MIKRKDVEALLATVEQVHQPNNGVIAELCRTWLSVMAAPVVQVTHLEQVIFLQAGKPIPNEGQRVRLVPVAEVG